MASPDASAPDPASIAAEIAAGAKSNLRIAALRAHRREFSRRLRKASPAVLLNVAIRLLDPPAMHRRFLAYELLTSHRAALASLGARDLQRLGRGIDSWEAVDTFALYLAGPAWRELQVSDDLVHRWARSRDRWWRRAALVCTVALNSAARGCSGDTSRTVGVCRLLAADHDDMVAKAMSWAIRVLAQRDPGAARRFIAEHRMALASRVIREVGNKLRTGLKNPRKGQMAKPRPGQLRKSQRPRQKPAPTR